MNISNWDIRRLSVFWLGVVTYILSFALVAVSGFRGYECAYLSLGMPLAEMRDRLTGRGSPVTLETLSLFASGLANPSFLLFAVTSRLYAPRGIPRLSQILTVVLIPFSVIFFFVTHAPGAVPHAGYYLWIVGMFLALASYKSFHEKAGPRQG